MEVKVAVGVPLAVAVALVGVVGVLLLLAAVQGGLPLLAVVRGGRSTTTQHSRQPRGSRSRKLRPKRQAR